MSRKMDRLGSQRVLREHLGLGHLEVIGGGSESVVYRGSRGSTSVVVKVHARADVFLRELDALQRLNRKQAPVPRLLEAYEKDRFMILIQEWWNCQPLSRVFGGADEDSQKMLLFEAGRLLALLDFALSPEELAESRFWHRPGFESFERYSWRRYLSLQVEKWIGRIKVNQDDIERGLPRRIACIRERVLELEEPRKPSILHADYVFRNILARDRRLCGVTDFEAVLMGDPIYDLAKLPWSELASYPPDYAAQFIGGWEATARQEMDVNRFKLYQAIQAVAAVSWVDKQPDSTAENLAFRDRASRALETTCPGA